MGSLGLVVHIGHGASPCPAPYKGYKHREMKVFDIGGVFTTNVQFCGCSKAEDGEGKVAEPYVQLLRARWLSATVFIPRTAVTFRCLDLICALNNQGKLTVYDFYSSLMHMTDNAGLDPPAVGAPRRCWRFECTDLSHRKAMTSSCALSAFGSTFTCLNALASASSLGGFRPRLRARALCNAPHALKTSLCFPTRSQMKRAPAGAD